MVSRHKKKINKQPRPKQGESVLESEEQAHIQNEPTDEVPKQLGMFRRLNNWVTTNNNALSSWSSIVSIISIPLIFVSLFIGYSQIKDLLSSPSIEIEFVHSQDAACMIINNSDKIAENILVAFGIFDLDSGNFNPLPIPSTICEWVNKKSMKGPMAYFHNFVKINHRYFGIVYISCKGCSSLETYWVYFKNGTPNESFYVRRNNKDPLLINMPELYANTETYLNQLIPMERRIPIRD